jgi:hypothetical protein
MLPATEFPVHVVMQSEGLQFECGPVHQAPAVELPVNMIICNHEIWSFSFHLINCFFSNPEKSDLGKVLLHPDFGGLPQWAVVGMISKYKFQLTIV